MGFTDRRATTALLLNRYFICLALCEGKRGGCGEGGGGGGEGHMWG